MTAGPSLPVDLLLTWDAKRARSQQVAMGMSEVGGCRRRAGYRLAGMTPTNPGGSIQAVLGTAVHQVLAEELAEQAKPGDLVEHEVEFAGIKGHIDRYDAETKTLIDLKTTSSRRLDAFQSDGVPIGHLYQTSLYAAALIKSGRPVRWVAIDYIARDTGATWRYSEPFDGRHTAAALEWLRMVRETELDMLNRDYQPSSVYCQTCPFLDVCWTERAVPNRSVMSALYVDHPDAAEWAHELEEARATERAAKDRADRAKGALDALRPNDAGKERLDVGHERLLQWSVTRRESIDQDAVRAEYAAAGASPPTRRSESVTLTFVKRPKGQEPPQEKAEGAA